MQTAILRKPRCFEIVERPRPVAGVGEAVVKIVATAVCHSDLEMYTGRHPGLRYPIVLGHEATGTVESVADNVVGLQPGQNVLINPVISCGRCDCCVRGDENLCRNAGIFGREIEGSLNQYVSLATRYLHPLPPNLSLAAATLIETLATVHHAQKRAGILAGETIVVLGQGTTGLLHTALARLAGADLIIAVSRTREKLELAKRMGAHHVVQADVAKAVDEAKRLTHGKGADVVIDTVGGAETLRAGIDMLRPGGRFLSFSLSHVAFTEVGAFPLYFKEISIIGSRALKNVDMAPSIELVAAGKIDVGKFITATYPLAQTAAAFEEYESNPGRILRIVIDSCAT
jgi:2-desacetyl-2-hydroxyethyl bacteriochlorophyllide A dehydrogenase